MATVHFNTGMSTNRILEYFNFDYLGTEIAAYSPEIQDVETPTEWRITSQTGTFTYTGVGFIYSNHHPTTGMVTSVSFVSPDGSMQWDVANASVSVVQVRAVPSSVGAWLFGGDDLIQGRLTLSSGVALNDVIASGAGNDTIVGGLGNDVLYGNQGNDVVVGGQGSDVLVGGMGADVCYGNESNDLIFGNEASDTIYAGQGNDTVYAGQGDDVIFGNQGNDLIFGNEGADTLTYAVNDGADTVQGFSFAEGDRINLQGLQHSVAQGADGAIITYLGGTIDLVGISAAAVDATYFV
jgi:Ca2+-binding RTX toxin-like protein